MTKKDHLIAVAACLLWPTAFIGNKVALAYAPPLFLAAIRFTLAGLVLVPFCFRGYWKNLKEHFPLILQVGLLQTTLLYSMYTYSLSMMPASAAAIVNGISPLYIAVIASLFTRKEPLDARKLVSLGIGVAGVVLIGIAKPSDGETQATWAGILLMLGAFLSDAGGNVRVALAKKAPPALILTSSQFILGGLVLFVLSFIKDGVPRFDYPLRFYIALAYLVVLASVAFSMWFYLLRTRKIPVSEVSIWKFLLPVFGAMYSWVYFKHDNPNLPSLIGMALTSVSVVLFFWGRRNGKKN